MQRWTWGFLGLLTLPFLVIGEIIGGDTMLDTVPPGAVETDEIDVRGSIVETADMETAGSTRHRSR